MKQKFLPGQRVRITDIMPDFMSHFHSGVDAIVRYTYGQEFSCGDFEQYSLWIINSKGEVCQSSAWYYEEQLTFVDNNIVTNYQMAEDYILNKKSKSQGIV